MYAVFLAILSVITLCRTDETHIAEIVFVPGRNKLRAIRVWPLQTHLDNTQRQQSCLPTDGECKADLY